jgi:hypothetical protein
MNKLLALAMILSSASSFASDSHWRVKFGGWSKHSDFTVYNIAKPNEDHRGLGIQYWKKSPKLNDYFDSTNFEVGGEAWYMKDSNNKDSLMLSTGIRLPYKTESLWPLTEASVVVGATYHYRSTMDVRYRTDTDQQTGEKYISYYETDISRRHLLTPMLMSTVTLFNTLDVDFTYIPSFFDQHGNIFFVRLGFPI